MILLDVAGVKDWKAFSKSKKWEKFLDGLPSSGVDKLEREFSFWLLTELKNRVRLAIRTQKFPVRYAPLNKEYVAQKKARGEFTGFWNATGFLCEHIKVWSREGRYHIGFPERDRHPKGGYFMAELVRGLELGDKKANRPPRPLFTPIARQMSKDVWALFETFISQKHPSLKPHLRG